MKVNAQLFAVLLVLTLAWAVSPVRAASAPDAEKTAELAGKAVVFGYPLLLMEATRRQMTAPQTPGGESVVNRFSHITHFPDHTFTDIVTPNADTLYSVAWLDLKAAPVALCLPETGDRYYVMQLMDAWTNVFSSIGTRTTGNREGAYLITGPDWTGDVPPGMVRVEAPTNMVWILGRTQTNGKSDYAAVHALQERYVLRPLAAAPADGGVLPPGKASPPERVEAMPAAAFFAELNRLMALYPPAAADAALLDELSVLSIGPGLDFDRAGMPEGVLEAMEKGHAAALASLAALDGRQFGVVSNGWSLLPGTIGDFGTDYRFRAFVARFGLGANLPEDAVYPAINADATGAPLNGRNRYTIHFAPGQLPPVRAFWSISMYNSDQHFVENSIGRYAIGDRDPLVRDADGGLTIYVQHDAPGGGREANWLPAPEGDFNMVLRLYWPEPSILDGSWSMPDLKKAE